MRDQMRRLMGRVDTEADLVQDVTSVSTALHGLHLGVGRRLCRLTPGTRLPTRVWPLPPKCQ